MDPETKALACILRRLVFSHFHSPPLSLASNTFQGHRIFEKWRLYRYSLVSILWWLIIVIAVFFQQRSESGHVHLNVLSLPF
jgi:hypothetical protein